VELSSLIRTVITWAVILWVLVFVFYHRDQVGHALSVFFSTAKANPS
jgi:hypothetical protein